MKKILCVLITLLMAPMIVFASDVKITKVEVLEKTDGVKVEDNKYEGLVSNIDLKLSEFADNIKYKITIQNDSDKVFNIDLKTNAESNKYLEYTYTGDTKIEPGKSGSITVGVEYAQNIVKEDLDKEEIKENVALAIVSDEVKDAPKEEEKEDSKEEKENPKTGVGLRFIIIASIDAIVIGVIVYNKTNKKSRFVSYLLLPLLIVPFAFCVKADEKLVINIHSIIENKPFIFRYVPYRTDDDYTIVGETRLINVNKDEIIEYEIPKSRNYYYGENFGDFTGYTIEEIKEMIRQMDYYLFDDSDTEGIVKLKNEATKEIMYVVLKETSRVITGYIHAYSPSIKFDIIIDTIEYNKETQKAISVNTNTLSIGNILSYIISTNPAVVNFNHLSNGNYTIEGGEQIESVDFVPTLRNYIKSQNQKFVIMVRENDPEVTEVVLKEGLNAVDEYYDMSTLGKYYHREGYATHYKAFLKMALYIDNNKYIADVMNEPDDIYDDESIVYHTIIYR